MLNNISTRTLVGGIIIGALVAALAIAVYAGKATKKITSKADEAGDQWANMGVFVYTKGSKPGTYVEVTYQDRLVNRPDLVCPWDSNKTYSGGYKYETRSVPSGDKAGDIYLRNNNITEERLAEYTYNQGKIDGDNFLIISKSEEVVGKKNKNIAFDENASEGTALGDFKLEVRPVSEDSATACSKSSPTPPPNP